MILIIVFTLCFGATLSTSDQHTSNTLDQSKEPKAEKLVGTNAETRFLGPETLEGLGRIFMLSGELASCYTCSVSFPIHAQSCCNNGYTSCCLNGPINPVYGAYGFRGDRIGYHRPGTCPVLSSSFQQACSAQCFYDSDCPGDYKCCAFGCSVICAQPLLPGSVIELEKPGLCPTTYSYGFTSGFFGNNYGYGYGGSGYHAYGSISPTYDSNLIADCNSDSDCPGSYKCCTRTKSQRLCTLPSFAYSYGR